MHPLEAPQAEVITSSGSYRLWGGSRADAHRDAITIRARALARGETVSLFRLYPAPDMTAHRPSPSHAAE